MNNQEQQNQILAYQLQQYEKALEKLNESIESLDELNNILEETSKLKKGEDLLIPVANGIFIKGKVEDTKEFLVNVGEGIVLKKTKEQTQTLIEKQKTEILKSKKEAEANIDKLIKMLEQ